MAVDENVSAYSTTAASNTPAGTDTVGPDLDNHLRDIKKNIRATAELNQGTTAPTGFLGRVHLSTTATASNRLDLRLYDGTAFRRLATLNTSSGVFGADLTLIQSQTASADASVDFVTGIDSTYDHYVVFFHNVRPASAGADLFLRISDDAGSTFKSGATDYEYNVVRRVSSAAGVASVGNSQGATEILLSGEIDADAGNGADGHLLFSDPSTSRASHYFESHIRTMDGSATPLLVKEESIGVYNGSTLAIDGIRFLFASGNITSGTFALYGLRKA